MTEQQWLASSDPAEMLEFLRGGGASDRKLRLFAVACCRHSFQLFRPRNSGRDRLDMAERYADGQAGEDELRTGRALIRCGRRLVVAAAGSEACAPEAMRAAEAAISLHARVAHLAVVGPPQKAPARGLLGRHSASDAPATEPLSGEDMAAVPAEILRDIFGYPFRPVAFDPDWRTGTVVALARQMYETRDFSIMNVMSDALQDAGCENEDVLNHCRGPNVHVRGCWVVDLVLGKA